MVRRAGLLAVAAVVLAGVADAQYVRPARMDETGWDALGAPAGCASGYVPYFDASLKLVCSPTVYAPATNTTTLGTLAAKNVVVTALPASGSITVTPTGTTGATTYTYSLQACLADGTCNAAGAASTTAAGNATLSATNFNRLSWSAVAGAASYKIRRDVGGATQGVIWTGTALTVDDTGLAGDGTGKPADDGTGSVTAGNYGTLVKTKNVTIDGGALTRTPVAAPGAPTLTATVAGTKPAGTWNYKATWVTATGETAFGTVSSNITVDGSKAITVARPADPPSVATGWKVYSSKQGPTATWWVTSGTIPIATTTYDDNTADAALTVNATTRDATAGRRVLIASDLGLNIGAHNTTTGLRAGTAITVGYGQSHFGFEAGRSATTAAYLTTVGFQAGFNSNGSTANASVTGNANTFVGAYSGLGSPTQRSNATALGASSYVDADNRVVLGNASVVDVWAGSTGQARLVGTGIRLVTGTRPTCDASTRGTIFYVAGGAGVADTCEVCRKDNADAYAWVSLF